MQIYIYEDVINQPFVLPKTLYSFLDVDNSFEPKSAITPFNSALLPGFHKLLRSFHLSGVSDSFKQTKVGMKVKKALVEFLRSKKNSSNDKPKIDSVPIEDDFHEFLKKYFHDDILEAQEIIGRDLSNWL